MKRLVTIVVSSLISISIFSQSRVFEGYIDQVICVDYCDLILKKAKTDEQGEILRLTFENDGKTLKLDNESKKYFLLKENYVELSPNFKGERFVVTCSKKGEDYIVTKLEVLQSKSDLSQTTSTVSPKSGVTVKEKSKVIHYADKRAYIYYEPSKMLLLKDNQGFILDIRLMIHEVENNTIQGKRIFKISLDHFYSALFAPAQDGAIKEWKNYNCNFNKTIITFQSGKTITIDQKGLMNCDAKIENDLTELQINALGSEPLKSIAIVSDEKKKIFSFIVPKEEQPYFVELILDINQINSGTKVFK